MSNFWGGTSHCFSGPTSFPSLPEGGTQILPWKVLITKWPLFSQNRVCNQKIKVSTKGEDHDREGNRRWKAGQRGRRVRCRVWGVLRVHEIPGRRVWAHQRQASKAHSPALLILAGEYMENSAMRKKACLWLEKVRQPRATQVSWSSSLSGHLCWFLRPTDITWHLQQSTQFLYQRDSTMILSRVWCAFIKIKQQKQKIKQSEKRKLSKVTF